MKESRIGIIGAGNIAQAHLEAFSHADNARVVAICDKVKERAEKSAKAFQIPDAYGSMEEMLARPDIDGVVLAVPNYVHEEACLKAARSGKHVLCEKPMTMTVGQAENMAAVCKEAGVQLLMGFVTRFEPQTELMKSVIDAGEVGDIYFAQTDILRRRGAPKGWFGNKEKSGGGPLIDIGVHMIDAAWYLMGRPRPVRAKALNYTGKIRNKYPKGIEIYSACEQDDVFDAEDSSHGIITFENGAGLMYQASWNINRPSDDGSLNICGTKGGLSFDPILYHETAGCLAETKLEAEQGYCFARQAEHFARVTQGLEAPRSPASDGITVQKMLCALYESARAGREVEIG